MAKLYASKLAAAHAACCCCFESTNCSEPAVPGHLHPLCECALVIWGVDCFTTHTVSSLPGKQCPSALTRQLRARDVTAAADAYALVDVWLAGVVSGHGSCKAACFDT